jgi:hypothetical protein
MDDNAGSSAPRNPNTFVAIDFETADRYRDSARAVSLVRVENWQITEQKCWLIRPPRKNFYFTYLHGISWKDVAVQPNFQELWPNLRAFMGTASSWPLITPRSIGRSSMLAVELPESRRPDYAFDALWSWLADCGKSIPPSCRWSAPGSAFR